MHLCSLFIPILRLVYSFVVLRKAAIVVLVVNMLAHFFETPFFHKFSLSHAFTIRQLSLVVCLHLSKNIFLILMNLSILLMYIHF